MRVSVVIPTKHRAAYLAVALRSVAGQAAAAGAEVLVVDDGPSPATRDEAAAWGAGYVAHPSSLGLNAARNTGLAATSGELVCFLDDDVEVWPGWLGAMVAGARAWPEDACFTGPVVARFDGFRPRFCGREGPPVTSLWLGWEDAVAPHAWGANMAVRRSAVEEVGAFDASLGLYGDEQEWQARLHAAGGRIRYLAAAGLDHRRAGADARIGALCSAARARGRAARREDVAKGSVPSLAGELRVLAGTLVHGPRFRCANGPILSAHSAGRLGEALRPSVAPGTPDFLSGRSGLVAGRRAVVRRWIDRLLDLAWRRGPSSGGQPERPLRVLVVGIERPGKLMDAVVAELRRSRHAVEVATSEPGTRGKFENLNALLAAHADALEEADWLLVVDDDVVLPAGFLDRFLALAERAGLRLAQPAHRLASHAGWPVTRRRPASLVRRTAFVEIGPVTAFHRSTFSALLPFPELRMGWGLDLHWAALARERGWPIGVVDATPILHVQPVGAAYGFDTAVAEARAFLASRPYVPRDEANRTLRTWR